MGLFNKFKKEKKNEKTARPWFLYSDEELDVLDSFICDMFGEYKNVFHEIASPDVHLDVCIVEPTDEDPYYKLVTMGAGAYTMAIPEQWKDYHIEHAEYVIYLPKDWNLKLPPLKP
ncbi:MAG: suppressor of fused domain protein [Firmicutes bacterium]|nr:suppressor of fused domain protein [Bacillota bacterium]